MQYEPDRCDPILVFVHFGFRNFGMLSIPQYILVLCEFTIISKFTHKNHILSIAVITCYIYIFTKHRHSKGYSNSQRLDVENPEHTLVVKWCTT